MSREFKFVSGLLAALFSAMSLISFVQSLTQLSLAESFAALIEWWKLWTRPIAQFLLGWIGMFGWHPPEWIHDYFILSLVLSSGVVRSVLQGMPHRSAPRERIGRSAFYVTVLLSWPTLVLFLAFTGLGFVGGMVGIANAALRIMTKRGRAELRSAREMLAQQSSHERYYERSIVNRHQTLIWAIATVAAVCAFYALNAFA